MSIRARLAVFVGGLLLLVAILYLFLRLDARTPPSEEISVLKVGALLPLTGDAAAYGNYTRQGIEVGVDKANEILRGQSKRIEVVFEDSRGNPRDGVSAAQKLIEVDKVGAIIDDSLSNVTLAVAPLCDRNQVVLISTGATSPKLSGISRFFFRIWNSDLEEGSFSANYAENELRPNRVAILYVNNEYGLGLRGVFESQFRGGVIAVIESFPEGATDLRPQLAKIKAASPELVYLVAYPKEAKLSLKQGKQLALKATWLGTVVMLEEEMPSLLQDLGYKMLFPAPALQEDTPAVRELRDRFQRKYPTEPPVLADVGYDAIVLLGMAFLRAEASGPSLQQALSALEPQQMASGLIRFDAKGDVHKPMVMKKIPTE